MNRKHTRYGLLVVLSLCVVGSGFAGDWTAWRGPHGNGITGEKGWRVDALQGSPDVAWQTTIGVGYSAVAVRGDRLYAIGNHTVAGSKEREGIDTVYCFDSATGKEIWRFSYPCTTDTGYPGPTASPVLDGDRLYTLSDDTGDLFCFDATNGTVKWKINVEKEFGAEPPNDGFGYSSSPVIEGDLLLLNINSSGIAVNKHSGKKVWASSPGRCSFSSPVVFDHKGQRRVALFGGEKLFILDPATGSISGAAPWETFGNENSADPLVFGDRVFVSAAYDSGCGVFTLKDGDPQLLWKNHALENLFTSSVYVDGYIYGIHGMRRRNALKCLDPETGEIKWSKKTDFGSLIVADGKLLMLTERGMLHVVRTSPEAYAEIASAKVVQSAGAGSRQGRKKRAYWWTNPVLANGRLYLRSDKGDLICLDLRTKM